MENHNDKTSVPEYDWGALRDKILKDDGIRNVTMTVILPHRVPGNMHNPQVMKNNCDSVEPIRTPIAEYYKSLWSKK